MGVPPQAEAADPEAAGGTVMSAWRSGAPVGKAGKGRGAHLQLILPPGRSQVRLGSLSRAPPPPPARGGGGGVAPSTKLLLRPRTAATCCAASLEPCDVSHEPR